MRYHIFIKPLSTPRPPPKICPVYNTADVTTALSTTATLSIESLSNTMLEFTAYG